MTEKSFENACCFFGHRRIFETEELKTELKDLIEQLILVKGVAIFLFGSKSRFNDLCYELVSQLKEKHAHIKRIYVRAEYLYINDGYKKYLSKKYEETYYPEKIERAGKAVYIERNFEMIDNSVYCIVYYDKSDSLTKRKSGAEIALQYAVKRKKEIYVFSSESGFKKPRA